jgi:hypothetical protein
MSPKSLAGRAPQRVLLAIAAALSIAIPAPSVAADGADSTGSTTPAITGLSPSSGPDAGGFTVKVKGTNLAVGGVAPVVTVNGVQVGTGTVSLPSGGTAGAEVDFVAPAGKGSVVVQVTTANGSTPATANGTKNLLKYLPPKAAKLAPTSGPEAGGTATLTGSALTDVTGVTVGGVAVATSTITLGGSGSAQTVTFTVPAGTGSKKAITVTNAELDTVTITPKYSYLPPKGAKVAPNSGDDAGGTSVTITGSNLGDVTSVTLGGVAVATSTIMLGGSGSAQTVTFITPAGKGSKKSITLTNAELDTVTITPTFSYLAPKAAKVSPATGSTAGGTVVTITGAHMSDVTSVTVGGTDVGTLALAGSGAAETVTFTTPAGTAGTQPIHVVNAEGDDVKLSQTFRYTTATTGGTPTPTATGTPGPTNTPTPTPTAAPTHGVTALVNRTGAGGAAQVSGIAPRAVAVDSTGNVYIADSANAVIYEWVKATGTVTTLISAAGGAGTAQDGAFSNPTAIALDGNGNLYIVNPTTLWKWAHGSSSLTQLAVTGAQYPSFNPTDVAVDASGNVYVLDFRVINGAGATGVDMLPGGTGSLTALVNSAGAGGAVQLTLLSGSSWDSLAVDASGDVYFGVSTFDSHLREDDTVYELANGSQTLTAKASVLGDNGSVLISGLIPTGLAADSAGNIYISDQGNAAVEKIAHGSSSFTTLVSQFGQSSSIAVPSFNPRRTAIDGSGNVYIADVGNNAVQKYVP